MKIFLNLVKRGKALGAGKQTQVPHCEAGRDSYVLNNTPGLFLGIKGKISSSAAKHSALFTRVSLTLNTAAHSFSKNNCNKIVYKSVQSHTDLVNE